MGDGEYDLVVTLVRMADMGMCLLSGPRFGMEVGNDARWHAQS